MIIIDGRDKSAVKALANQFGAFDQWGPHLTITTEMILRYADESGDHNPPHVDRTVRNPLVAHGRLLLQKLPLLRPEPLFSFSHVQWPYEVEGEHRLTNVVLEGDTIHARERVAEVFYKEKRFRITYQYVVHVATCMEALALKGAVTLLYYLQE